MSSQDLYRAIDRAAPFLDQGWTGEGWQPSELMTIGTCILATGEHPELAREFVTNRLDLARQLWRDGFYADPFAKEPKRREADA